VSPSAWRRTSKPVEREALSKVGTGRTLVGKQPVGCAPCGGRDEAFECPSVPSGRRCVTTAGAPRFRAGRTATTGPSAATDHQAAETGAQGHGWTSQGLAGSEPEPTQVRTMRALRHESGRTQDLSSCWRWLRHALHSPGPVHGLPCVHSAKGPRRRQRPPRRALTAANRRRWPACVR